MAVPLSFTFIDPNSPEAVEYVLRRILIGKLTDDSLPGKLPENG